jgi:hypothetical protein
MLLICRRTATFRGNIGRHGKTASGAVLKNSLIGGVGLKIMGALQVVQDRNEIRNRKRK